MRAPCCIWPAEPWCRRHRLISRRNLCEDAANRDEYANRGIDPVAPADYTRFIYVLCSDCAPLEGTSGAQRSKGFPPDPVSHTDGPPKRRMLSFSRGTGQPVTTRDG